MTQKILSHPLSLHRQPSLFTQIERPWCRTFARPLLLNHPADLPPEPTAAVPTSPAITAAPSSDWSGVFLPSSRRGGLERVATPSSLQQLPAPSAEAALHPALPTNRGRSSAALSPSIWWVGTLVCTAEVQRHLRDPSATLLTSCWGFHCPRVTPSTWPKHTTINGGLVCLYLCLSCLYLCLILICFVLFD